MNLNLNILNEENYLKDKSAEESDIITNSSPINTNIN